MILAPFEVVLMPFPFADRLTEKLRPAVVVSTPELQTSAGAVWLAMITSAKTPGLPGDVPVTDLVCSGLRVPCRGPNRQDRHPRPVAGSSSARKCLPPPTLGTVAGSVRLWLANAPRPLPERPLVLSKLLSALFGRRRVLHPAPVATLVEAADAPRTTRTETDTFGPIEVAVGPLLGRPGAALARQLQDRLGEAAAADRARAGHRQARRGRGQHGARPARPEDRRRHRRAPPRR